MKGNKRQANLFEPQGQQNMPLANRLRPTDFEQFIGQEHLVAEGKFL